jgi:hypothetical protein
MSLAERIAQLEQEERELDQELRLKELERKVAEKRERLRAYQIDDRSASSHPIPKLHQGERPDGRIKPAVPTPMKKRTIGDLTPEELARKREYLGQEAPLRLTENKRDDIKNSAGVAKIRKLQYTSTKLTLTKANVSVMARQITRLANENGGLRNKQVQVVFESNLNSSNHTDLILLESKGELTRSHIENELRKILANKISTDSPGQWVITDVNLKGAI